MMMSAHAGAMSAQAFLDSDAQELVLGPSAFQGPTLGLHPSLHAQQEALRASSSDGSGTALLQQLAQHTAWRCGTPCSHACLLAYPHL